MNRIIRWPGLAVFVLIVMLVGGGTVLFAGKLVEKGIEYAGTEMVGARVDVDRVSLSLSPLGFQVARMQVTDPEHPMVNAFEVSEIDFFMDTAELLRWKTVITDMQIKGLRVNTPRSSSGAILRPAEQQTPGPDQAGEQGAGSGLPVLGEVDVAAVFQREELASLEHINRLRVDLGQAREQWKTALAGMPNEVKIASYRQRLQQVEVKRSGNTAEDLKRLERARKELKKIRDELKADIRLVDNTRKEVRLVSKTIKDSADDVSAMVNSDVERLREKYSLSPQGLSNISGLLFGEQVRMLLQESLIWYRKLMPIYQRFEQSEADGEERPARFKGRDIRFPEQRPLPDFLVRKAGISMELPVGKITGEIRNLTSDQSVLGHPLTFHLFSKEMHDVQDIEITGSFNHVEQGNTHDSVHLIASHISLSDREVLADQQFPLRLLRARLDVEGDMELIGKELGANVKANFIDTSFAVPFAGKPGVVAEGLAEAMKGVNGFDAAIVVSGALDNNQVKFSSSLDNVLKAAVSEQVSKAAAKLTTDLKQGLRQRLQEPQVGLEQELGELRRTAEDLDKLRARLKAVEQEGENRRKELEAGVSGKKDVKKKQLKEQKDELRDKLKDKLRF